MNTAEPVSKFIYSNSATGNLKRKCEKIITDICICMSWKAILYIIISRVKQDIVLKFPLNFNYKISKILSRFFFTVFYKPVSNVRFPFSKDTIPLLNRSYIYCIPCECGVSYIGETKEEYKRYVFKLDDSKLAVSD